jgi:hypothetical protein
VGPNPVLVLILKVSELLLDLTCRSSFITKHQRQAVLAETNRIWYGISPRNGLRLTQNWTNVSSLSKRRRETLVAGGCG